MKKEFYECEVCALRAYSEQELRRDEWLQINGGPGGGISVLLDKSRRKEPQAFCLTVGFQSRHYHFCSVKCLVRALQGKDSI